MPADGHGDENVRVVRSEVFSEAGAVVIVEGDLDVACAGQLRSEIGRRIGEGHRHFVVDLTAATFIDSVAMMTLLVAMQPLRTDPGAAVALCGASGAVTRSLEVSGVGGLFPRFARRDEAVDALQTSTVMPDGWRHARGSQ